MLTIIEKLFTPQEVAAMRESLLAAEWQDGAATAGSRSITVKQNLQIPTDSPLGQELGAEILRRLRAHPLFVSAALPHSIHPPKFNLYKDGGHYGLHVDAALMTAPSGNLMRTDLSATLFLNDPQDYEGGELTIETPFGNQAVKLPAGDLVLYPANSLHQVTPVTKGYRLASFFWMQSLVPDEGERSLLFDLDQTIQSLAAQHMENGAATKDPQVDRLGFIYHNLLRRWTKL
jgi:PKHD-type hydroxylase